MPTIELKSQKEIQIMFDKASFESVQHYHWIPPEWPEIQASNFLLEDNSIDSGKGLFPPYPGYPSVEEFIADRRPTAVEKDPDADHHGNRKQWKWPSPSANTDHHDSHGHHLPDSAPAMKRLSLIFEWSVLRATITLNDINRALNVGKDTDLEDFDPQPADARAKYEAARSNYLSFLRDLDDHHPKDGGDPLVPDLGKKLTPKEKGRKSGYGLSLRWVYIAPVIYKGRIEAARIIMLWNPHSSSLGVAVKH